MKRDYLWKCPKTVGCLAIACSHRRQHRRDIDPKTKRDYCNGIPGYCPECKEIRLIKKGEKKDVKV